MGPPKVFAYLQGLRSSVKHTSDIFNIIWLHVTTTFAANLNNCSVIYYIIVCIFLILYFDDPDGYNNKKYAT